MPLKNGRRTHQERAVVEAYVATGSVTEAARRAGYAQPSAASKALARPELAAEVLRRQRERLITEGLPLAVDTLVSIMQNELQPAGARVSAAKIVLDHTKQDEQGRDKSIADMLPEELVEELAKARAAVQARKEALAKAVDVEILEDDQAPSVLD